jgi:ACGX-repeat protein
MCLFPYDKPTEGSSESDKEDEHMALKNLVSWNVQMAPAACGAACGAGDKPAEEKKPAACGAACGAADKPVEQPAACGAADKPAEEKPAACGAACGAGDK